MSNFKFIVAFALVYAQSALAETYVQELQTVYTETPVSSYYAYPDDQNFIPEVEFMRQDNEINYDMNIINARDAQACRHPGVGFAERPMIVCRNFNCTRLNDRITRNFLFNSLSTTFMMNDYSRLYICEADPFSRDCLQSGITFPIRSGIANALVKIPKASISQVSLSTGLSRASVGMTYTLLVNGIDRPCNPTMMDIFIPVNSQATLVNHEFSCNLTSDGVSNVSIIVNLDYIDLDYGILGGYYSIGTQGSTSGGGTGYALFKTQYSNRGINFVPAGGTNITKTTRTTKTTTTDINTTIKPGEYAVEPMKQ